MTRISAFLGRRQTLGLMVLLAAAAGPIACGKSDSPAGGGQAKTSKTIIQNKGSDTLVNVAQAWAEQYQKVAPDVEVEVSGGGSGVGIAALIKGAVDIANSSREMKPEEMSQAKKATGKEPKGFTVGHDALAVYVHTSNPLNEINVEQLADMFGEGGKVTRWSEIGVKIPGVTDDTIVLVSRQSSSGTYEFFREHVLGKRDFRLGSRDLSGSKDVVQLVGSTPTAIGYSGMGYATPAVKKLKLAGKQGAASVEATVENTLNKSYPLARSLHVYTLGEPQDAVKGYIDWIMSEAGQKIVQESGFVPIPGAAPALPAAKP